MWIILTIVLICVVVLIIKPYLKPHDSVELWVGTNGSGKTLNAVKKSVLVSWKKNCLKVFIHNIFHREKIAKPIILSNIPIMYRRKVISYELTEKHLLGVERMPEYCVVFIDEVSLWLSQMDFKNKNIKVADDMATLFRHYTKGNLVMTTQDPNKCAFPYRYCTGSAFVLSDFKKHWWSLFKVASSSIRHISITGDIQAIEINQKEDNEERIYVSLFTRNYDTYAFSERYKNVPFGELKKHTGLKVVKVLRCPKEELKSHIGE